MNSYDKQEQHKERLIQLAEKAVTELYKLSFSLKISPEDLLRILADEQGITPELGRRIDYLWQIRFGTARVEVPKPFLPVIKECRAYTYLSGLEHGDIIYMPINHRDTLPDCGEGDAYDHAMDPIRDYIDDWAATFMRRKDKAMQLVQAKEPSESPHYESECPDSRQYEFELIDEEEEKRYKIVYSKGKIIYSKGKNLPLEEIVSLLKKIGKWET
jgi:hypothetical protein